MANLLCILCHDAQLSSSSHITNSVDETDLDFKLKETSLINDNECLTNERYIYGRLIQF